MTLPSPIQAFVDATQGEALDFLTVAEQRQFMRHSSDLLYLRFGQRGEPVASVTDYTVPVDGGEIRMRAYRPSSDTPLPGHIFLHGGAWWLGSIDEYVNDALCRYRCNHARCVVLAVGYRLAPEHKFPTAIDDVRAARDWIAQHADTLGVDAQVISIGGTSAGANLAAAIALACRDSTGPALVFQLLEVPVMDLTLEHTRIALEAVELAPLGIHPAHLDLAVRHYLPDPRQALAELASPIHAADLSGLPPAHVITAELDPLREEGEHYAQLLAAADIPVTTQRYPHAVHATSFLTRTWSPARDWQHDAATVLRQAHERACASLEEDRSARRG
jgi:acetyl esterase